MPKTRWSRRRGAILIALTLSCSDGGTTLTQSPATSVVDGPISWTIIDLGGPSFSSSGLYPHAIGTAGDVVGQGQIDGATHGILRTSGGAFVDLLPAPGDLKSFPQDINIHRVSVGISSLDANYTALQPVMWGPNGVPEVLPGFGGRGPSHDAIAINDAGLIVGRTSLFEPGVDHAFLWRPGTNRPVSLDQAFPGMHSMATDISERGEIVGWSRHQTLSSVAVTWSFDRRYCRGPQRTVWGQGLRIEREKWSGIATPTHSTVLSNSGVANTSPFGYFTMQSPEVR